MHILHSFSHFSPMTVTTEAMVKKDIKPWIRHRNNLFDISLTHLLRFILLTQPQNILLHFIWMLFVQSCFPTVEHFFAHFETCKIIISYIISTIRSRSEIHVPVHDLIVWIESIRPCHLFRDTTVFIHSLRGYLGDASHHSWEPVPVMGVISSHSSSFLRLRLIHI